MLFLKRLSDEFDRKRQQLREHDFTHLKEQPELLAELLEDKDLLRRDLLRACPRPLEPGMDGRER